MTEEITFTEQPKDPTRGLTKVLQKAEEIRQKHPERFKSSLEIMSFVSFISLELLEVLLNGEEIAVGSEKTGWRQFKSSRLSKEGAQDSVSNDRPEGTGKQGVV